MRTRTFGCIVNVSNIAAIRTNLLHGVPEVTTKEALYGFTWHLVTEVAQHGSMVNATLPGFAVTPELRASWPEERFERLAPTIPARRAGAAEEVVSLVGVVRQLRSKAPALVRPCRLMGLCRLCQEAEKRIPVTRSRHWVVPVVQCALCVLVAPGAN